MLTEPSLALPSAEPVRINAHRASIKHLGTWTTARHFDLRASSSAIVLDFLLAPLRPGDIEITLDMERSMLKLLVPDGVVIDHDDLRRVGRGRVKDWTGVDGMGRRIRLLGEMRRSEVRVHRGGIAVVSLVVAGQARRLRQAHRDGRLEQLVTPTAG